MVVVKAPAVKIATSSSVTGGVGTLERPTNNYKAPQQQQQQPPQTLQRPPYQPSPVMYVKKEERTVASLLGDDDDEDGEIGLDELDDEYLNASSSPSPPPTEFQRHNSMTRKQANSFILRSMNSQKSPVSLTQLPPPLENCIVESDLEVLANASPAMKQLQASQGYLVHSHIGHSTMLGGGYYTNRQHNNPIQVQFHAGAGGVLGGGGGGTMTRGGPTTSPSTENLVLAPPPQFSDGAEMPVSHGGGHHHGSHYHGAQVGHGQASKLGPNVRIVGAVPKSSGNRF